MGKGRLDTSSSSSDVLSSSFLKEGDCWEEVVVVRRGGGRGLLDRLVEMEGKAWFVDFGEMGEEVWD